MCRAVLVEAVVQPWHKRAHGTVLVKGLKVDSLAEELVDTLGVAEYSVEHPGKRQAEDCTAKEDGVHRDILPHPVQVYGTGYEEMN
ncbi:hypothetical protein DPMN_121783 [Dreissena polymorpha]|uniref:Uncharacterized protein n=1 Tax=Dreissena polymorpha TaxID=45954 RepID=A0A9D4JRD1_DREPO|nr:hypothetical protein DPMN_121783 [Dreissena polymorpha]